MVVMTNYVCMCNWTAPYQFLINHIDARFEYNSSIILLESIVLHRDSLSYYNLLIKIIIFNSFLILPRIIKQYFIFIILFNDNNYQTIVQFFEQTQ